MLKDMAEPKDLSGKPKKKKKAKVVDPQMDFLDFGAEFLNREIQWLEFNDRVLHEALDQRNPLLERVRFLGIFTSNLDEFFMKRVGGLKQMLSAGVLTRKGVSAVELLQGIRRKVKPQLERQAHCFQQLIRPQLNKHGVFLLRWKELEEAERLFAQEYFRNTVFPVLTPLAVDPGHPFPFISNLSISLGVVVTPTDREERLFARVKIPKVFPQWIRLPSANNVYRFVSLTDVVSQNLDQLFPKMTVLGVMPFRITRNADVERDEEDAEDLLEMIEEELKQRRFGNVVRLEHGHQPDPTVLRFLQDELDLSEDDLYEMSDELDYQDLKPISDLPLPQLKFESWTPTTPIVVADDQTNILNVLRTQDLLVHHPYESFSATVERFLKTAADDPKVLAIKMTMYRIGDDSAFIPHLVRAAENGKQVVCLVELKARFDEARNIFWAQNLEDAGVHVVYGIVGLKTHAKVTLVVRQEADGLRCFTHIGTGNYNGETAKFYTDLGLLTSKKEITDDVVDLFHYLTGRSLKKDYRKLLVAPVNMRDRFIEMIRREISAAERGEPAQVIAKMNNLDDVETVNLLYEAGRKGVKIDLIVRGFCILRPQVPGYSDNIRVISVLGRFLEHSRIYYFRAGQADPLHGEFYIGSADWMYRNLSNRVEAIVPIEDPLLKEKTWEILQVMLEDRRQTWEGLPDGSYLQRKPADANQEQGTHNRLMAIARRNSGLGG